MLTELKFSMLFSFSLDIESTNAPQNTKKPGDILRCNSVAQLHGIGKKNVLKKLSSGILLDKIGDVDATFNEIVNQATSLIAGFYGFKDEQDLTTCRSQLCCKSLKKLTFQSVVGLQKAEL